MGKILNKTKEVITGWFKKFGTILAIVLVGVLTLFTGKKLNLFIQKKDNEKKEEIKTNTKEAKENIEAAKETTAAAKSEIETFEKEVKESQKEADKDKKDYISEQTDTAKKAGFKKKKND